MDSFGTILLDHNIISDLHFGNVIDTVTLWYPVNIILHTFYFKKNILFFYSFHGWRLPYSPCFYAFTLIL